MWRYVIIRKRRGLRRRKWPRLSCCIRRRGSRDRPGEIPRHEANGTLHLRTLLGHDDTTTATMVRLGVGRSIAGTSASLSITLCGSLSAADETCGETDGDYGKDTDRTTDGTTKSGDVAWFGGGAGEIKRRLDGDRSRMRFERSDGWSTMTDE